MRKLLALAAVVALATPAFAGLTLDSRFDYVSATTTSTTSTTSKSISGFQFTRLRVAGEGSAADAKFKVRLNPLAFSAGTQTVSDGQNANTLKAAGSTAAGTSNLVGTGSNQPNDFVEYAQMATSLSDGLTLEAGKLADIGFSGFEGEVNPGDFYFSSQSYLAGNYFIGAQLTYKLQDNQNLGFVFANNNNSADTTRPAAGLWYEGSFGMLSVRGSYHVLSQGVVTGTTKDANLTVATVGVGYKMDDWKFSLDYDLLTTTNSSNNQKDKTQSSIVGTARYEMAHWTPYLKVESTSRQGYQSAGTSEVTDSISNVALAAEYKKNAADPFRYELAYVSSSTNYASTTAYAISNASPTAAFAYAGVRYMGDFLK